MFLNLPGTGDRDVDVETLLHEAHRNEVSAMLLAMHPQAGLGRAAVVNLWLEPAPLGSDIESAIDRTPLEHAIAHAPQSGMDIFGVAADVQLDFVRRMVEQTRSSCLFTVASGRENALA